MKFISTTDEALTFLKNQIDLLVKKTEEVNPSIKSLIPYEHNFDILKYGLEYIANSGKYVSSTYYRKNYQEDDYTIDQVAERKQSLITLLDTILPSLEETRLKNAEIISHNKEIVEKIKIIMKTIGIPDSYSERDYKSRSRNPKYVTQAAGYLGDIRRNVPLTDTGYSNIKSQVDNLKLRINGWTEKRTKTIRETEAAALAEKKKNAKVKFLASLCGKYGIDAEEEDENVLLDVILERNKYLRLAHYMLCNRNDWNDGPDFAERGLDRFTIDSEKDQKIYNSISEDIENWEGDGRVFRDGEYGYEAIFAMVEDEDLYNDYIKLTGIFPDLT